MAVEYDPTLELWPGDPVELREFVQGLPDDGLRRLATAMAAAIEASLADRADLRQRVEALEAQIGATDAVVQP